MLPLQIAQFVNMPGPCIQCIITKWFMVAATSPMVLFSCRGSTLVMKKSLRGIRLLRICFKVVPLGAAPTDLQLDSLQSHALDQSRPWWSRSVITDELLTSPRTQALRGLRQFITRFVAGDKRLRGRLSWIRRNRALPSHFLDFCTLCRLLQISFVSPNLLKVANRYYQHHLRCISKQ